MLLGIDHIVIACHDPDAAAEALRQHVGLAPGGGGSHPRYGTFNRLVWLGDAYLELMGVADADLARGRGIGAATQALLESGHEGFASFAVASDDVVADIARLRGHGSTIAEPTPGERIRPDGEVVRWHTSIPPVLGREGVAFVIGHSYQGAEWGPAAREARARFVQPFGGVATLARLEIAVDDPAVAAARYHAELGLLITPALPGPGVDLPIGATLLRLVPRGVAAAPVTIVIAATGGTSRAVDVLGCRFVVEVASSV